MATLTYKCPNCDGGLIFDPESQRFSCEYCMSKFTEAELEVLNPASQEDTQKTGAGDTSSEADDSNNADATNGVNNGETMEYTCPSCGAEVVTDITTAATFCYYCHNPVVLQSRLTGDFTPDKVIPFEITREDAVRRFLGWTGKKWFIPSNFFSKRQIDTITGVYFPHWVVDSDTSASIDAEGKVVRTWTTGDTRYTNTKIYQVIRDADIHLEDVTRPALKKANKKLVDGIHPFNDKKMKDFSMAYLSGFVAEKRDIERNELEEDVNNEIHRHSQSLIRGTASDYTSIGAGIKSEIKSTDWSYALLPVWTLTYKGGDGDIYYFALNGESGKISGKLPIAFGKLALLFGAISVPVFIILTIWGLLQ